MKEQQKSITDILTDNTHKKRQKNSYHIFILQKRNFSVLIQTILKYYPLIVYENAYNEIISLIKMFSKKTGEYLATHHFLPVNATLQGVEKETAAQQKLFHSC